jgi:pilus assembly protein Flp/PilA
VSRGVPLAPCPTTKGWIEVLLGWYVGAQIRWLGLRERLVEERGATAVEYAIMLGFIAAVIVAAVAYLGKTTNSQFEKVTFDPP